MQNLNKLWPCGFKNGMRDGWNFIRAHKSLKIVHWWAFFVQSTLCFCLVWALRSSPPEANMPNFHASSWKTENVHLDRIHLSKAYKYLDKKVQKSYDTEEWCKVWRKTDSWFQKWHEEFGEFYCEQWHVWKFALWCTIFANTTSSFSLKSRELPLITLKNDPKTNFLF